MSVSPRLAWAHILPMVCAMMLCCPATAGPLGAEDDSGDSVPAPDASATSPDTSPLPTWRLGAYVGVLSHKPFTQIIFEPWNLHPQPSYLFDVHAVRTLHRFEKLPLELELEGGVAKRFGQDHQSEVDLLPMVRWKSFPWNEHLYTNARVGLIGASYVSGISPWEKQNSDVGHGSRYLNFLITELDFARSAHAPYEFFVCVHHRSGMYTLINGVYGGSTYYSIGVRFAVR